MDNPEGIENVECEMPQQQLLNHEDNNQLAKNALLVTDNTDTFNIVNQNSNSENQLSTEKNDVSSQSSNVPTEISSAVSTDNSVPPLPPLPKDDKGQTTQPLTPYTADYNMQNYANYNYMYNYNNYYGYPYPQYQWDYNSQQYYQPYQNYYNYNFNANQAQTTKPPPPPSDAVQLPVEEKPANKTAVNATVDDSNRYSPTAETDDDDTMKGLSENNKTDTLIEQSTQSTTSFTNPSLLQTLPSEQIEIQHNTFENIDSKVQQPIASLPAHHKVVPVIAQVQPYNIPVQQLSYLINPQMQPTEFVNETPNQHLSSPALNGKDESTEKVSKGSTVLGKSQAKKRLMAFSMMKQKLQEQNNSVNDNQNSDIGEGNDGEFVPELNVFQTVTKKKVVTNKKVAKVIKAQQTIEQIEEMKKDEILQGNNAALYQHLLRSGGNEAPILQKLGIESLAEKYSAKIREQDKRLKRHHHRRRDASRRGHKHRRRSHSKSRSRSKSTEKPKMRALEVKSWKDFNHGGFHFDKFRRFKMDEAEEMKEKVRKSRTKKRHGDSRSDGKYQNESSIPAEAEKKNGEHKLRYNLLDKKKEILKGIEVVTQDGDFTKDFPSYILRCTKAKPVLKFSENPARATYHLQNRQQMLATLTPEIETIVQKFLLAMKPKKLKENPTDVNVDNVDENLLAMMKDKSIYPFKGWWPKTYFIVTQVKKDPNIEIDNDALINELTTSKRTKKSRFNDDTSLVDLRPTVPSKWDSDYDGSPAAEKVADILVSQNSEINNSSSISVVSTEKDIRLDVSHREDEMGGTTSDIGKVEPNIEVNIPPILPTPQEPHVHAKLDTEYEEFLKIVSAEKTGERVEDNNITSSIIQYENENVISMKSSSLCGGSLQDESEEDSSIKSSDDSASSHSVAEELTDRSFVKSISSIDKKPKKKKKASKKSKKIKKKGSKKKKKKSSSSESSQDSESESDSSSEDSESGTTDSTSTAEKKKKKKKSKNKKKKKSKSNYKKKHKVDKNKTKKPEVEKDGGNSILNLIEKAFNVEIKKRPLDSEEPKQKKKKRKYEKKEENSIENNEDELEKVKECLKETFTKLVKTDKVGKNQSLSCDDNTVSEVLKYLKMDDGKEKKKKSKKSLKRKHDSDDSHDKKTCNQSRLEDSLKSEDNEKRRKRKRKKNSAKKSIVSDELVSKKNVKKSKTTDTSDTEDGEELKVKNSEHFFGQRPNEWNVSKTSSMRGVVHNSEVKNKNCLPSDDIRRIDDKIKNKSKSPHSYDNKLCPSLDGENPRTPSMSEKNSEQKEEQIPNNNVKRIIYDSVSKNTVGEKIRINLKNSDSESDSEPKIILKNDKIINIYDKCNVNMLENKNDIQQTALPITDNIEQEDLNDVKAIQNDLPIVKPSIPTEEILSYTDKVKINLKKLSNCQQIALPTTDNIEQEDLNHIKATQYVPLNQNDELPIIKSSIPTEEAMSYRDKVKMNLKKLSNCQHLPFILGFPLPLNIIKSNSSKTETQMTTKEVKPKVDESNLLKFDEPIKVIYPPQTQKEEKPNVTKIISPEIVTDIKNETIDQSYNWDDSEESNSVQSFETNTNTHKSDKLESEIKSSSLETESFDKNKEIITYENKIQSNDSETNNSEHVSNTSESGSTSDSESEPEFKPPVTKNTVTEEKSTFSSMNHLRKPKEYYESNSAILLNYVEPDTGITNNNVLCSHSNAVDSDVSSMDNELITQWKYEWSKLDESVPENNISRCYSLNDPNKSRKKKKSRWDEQPKVDQINDIPSCINEILLKSEDKNTNYNIEELKITSFPPVVDEPINEQNQMSEISSINCVNNGTEYDCYLDSWSNEYDNYSPSYDQYSSIPQYSEMKTIDQLNVVDYSIYENYNPDYNYHDDNYDVWKSIDVSHELLDIPTTCETPPAVQMGNVLEILPSDNLSDYEAAEIVKDEISCENTAAEIVEDEISCENTAAEIVKDEISCENVASEIVKDEMSCENAVADIPGVQNEVRSDTVNHNKQFVQLFQQYCQHYFKSPFEYSISDPAFVNSTEVKIGGLEKLPFQENDTEHENDNTVPIPIRDRAYSVLLEDDNNIVYLTSDRYIAYCAIEDKCMVHVALDTSSRDGIEDKVRHCFNINQNGTSMEYWLHADLIPFHGPYDNESGVCNDDDEDSGESDSGHDDVIVSCDKNVDSFDVENDYNENQIEGEWELVISDSDNNGDSWLNDPSILDKYGDEIIVGSEQTVTDINQDENVLSSSEYDSDVSEGSKKPSHTKKQNVIVNPFQKSEIVFGESNLCVKTVDNISLSDQLVSNIKIENKSDKSEILENLALEIDDTENNYEISRKLENEKIGVQLKEVSCKDLYMINKTVNQQILIQTLKHRTKEKIWKKLPDTNMIHFNDNMETVKHPFLGLFQPPTISIVSKQRNYGACNTGITKSSLKSVTFADGIHPGDDEATSSTHDEGERPLSPIPVKALMRESLGRKHNMYSKRKLKMRTKVTMVNKKQVATVTPLIKTATSLVIEYYVSRDRLKDLPIPQSVSSDVVITPPGSNNLSKNDGNKILPPRLTRESTPIPLENECWNDDGVKDRNR